MISKCVWLKDTKSFFFNYSLILNALFLHVSYFKRFVVL